MLRSPDILPSQPSVLHRNLHRYAVWWHALLPWKYRVHLQRFSAHGTGSAWNWARSDGHRYPDRYRYGKFPSCSAAWLWHGKFRLIRHHSPQSRHPHHPLRPHRTHRGSFCCPHPPGRVTSSHPPDVLKPDYPLLYGNLIQHLKPHKSLWSVLMPYRLLFRSLRQRSQPDRRQSGHDLLIYNGHTDSAPDKSVLPW